MKYYDPEIWKTFRAVFESTLDPTAVKKMEVYIGPAFHPSTRIAIQQFENFTSIELNTPPYEIWALRNPIKVSDIKTEIVEIPNEAVSRFWHEMKNMPHNKKPAFGIDGIGIDIRFEDAEGEKRLKTWSPKQKSHEGKIVDLIVKLAFESLSTLTSIARLEQILSYTTQKLNVRIVENKPLKIRFYGGLEIDSKAQLAEFLEKYFTDEPVIVDMTNVDWICDAFHPLFEKFNERPGSTCWLINNVARAFLAGK